MLLSLFLACQQAPPPDPPPARPCAECHADTVALWQGSHHALAERPLTEADAWAHDLGATRIIGVDPLQQALVPSSQGRVQAHSTAWDPALQETFPLHTDGRSEGEWGHWTGGGMTWNGRCAACHNTGVDKAYDGSAYATSVGAVGVRCEACHGDTDAHARGGPPPTNAHMEDTCAVCHLRRAELGVPLRPGRPLLDQVLPSFIDQAVFRADGRGLDEVFATNFFASDMHAAGVRCADCHNPHSGALEAQGDALCSRCHDPVPPHPAHPPLACVECHMPTTTVMQRHPRRDHGFTTPRAGQQPDPCADCHSEHPADTPPDPQHLAFERVRTGGPLGDLDLRPGNRWRRAAVTSLLGGYPEAEPVLREALQSADPLLRVAAATAWNSPTGNGALRPLLTDPVRAVRVAAQRTWMAGGGRWSDAPDYRTYLTHNLDDPLTRGEYGLRLIEQGDRSGVEELLAAGTADPGSIDLKLWTSIALSRVGRLPRAVSLLEKARVDHPENDDLLWSLALGLAGVGRNEDALAKLELLVERQPTHAGAWRNLALLRKDGPSGPFRTALKQAQQLNPGDRQLQAWADSIEP